MGTRKISQLDSIEFSEFLADAIANPAHRESFFSGARVEALGLEPELTIALRDGGVYRLTIKHIG